MSCKRGKSQGGENAPGKPRKDSFEPLAGNGRTAAQPVCGTKARRAGHVAGRQPVPEPDAFAFTQDLGTIVLATPRDTRKFANIAGNPNAALLVDNRKNTPEDSSQALAVTILGEVQAVEGDRAAGLRDIFLARHPHLEEFVSNPDTALLQIKVRRYIVVSEFQNTMTIEV